jgi:pyruvate dehydrogenase (quinone)
MLSTRKSVAQVLVDTLVELGVKRAYGLPGDSVNPVVDALRVNPRISFVHTTREDSAALAASFEAKLTGQVVVCLGAAGPGAVLLLNGLYDAKMDHAPVLAITGQIETEFLGLDYSKEVNTLKLFDDVASYNVQLTNPVSAHHIVKRAYREALEGQGVSHISAPVDVLKQDVELQPASITPTPPSPPQSVDVGALVDQIDRCERPLILVGRGGYGCGTEISEFADTIGAPIMYSLNGKGVVDDSDPKVLGGIGVLGTQPSFEALANADLLILLGCSFPHFWYMPRGLRIVQVDSNPRNLGKRYALAAGCVCDVKHFLAAAKPKPKDKKFYDELKYVKAQWDAKMREAEESHSRPIKPQRLMAQLSRNVSRDTPVVVDVGSILVWASRNFHAKSNQKVLSSAWYGSMGVGVPGSLGVALSSGKPTLAIVGDGGMNMSALELATAKRYGAPIKVVVANNGKLSMIKFEQEMAGYQEWATVLPNPDYVRLAESMGIKARTVEDPRELGDAVSWLLEDNEPAVLDVHVDGDEPPLPAELPRIE